MTRTTNSRLKFFVAPFSRRPIFHSRLSKRQDPSQQSHVSHNVATLECRTFAPAPPRTLAGWGIDSPPDAADERNGTGIFGYSGPIPPMRCISCLYSFFIFWTYNPNREADVRDEFPGRGDRCLVSGHVTRCSAGERDKLAVEGGVSGIAKGASMLLAPVPVPVQTPLPQPAPVRQGRGRCRLAPPRGNEV